MPPLDWRSARPKPSLQVRGDNNRREERHRSKPGTENEHADPVAGKRRQECEEGGVERSANNCSKKPPEQQLTLLCNRTASRHCSSNQCCRTHSKDRQPRRQSHIPVRER